MAAECDFCHKTAGVYFTKNGETAYGCEEHKEEAYWSAKYIEKIKN